MLLHPLDNSATTEIASSDLLRFLEAHGLSDLVQIVNFEEETKRHQESTSKKLLKSPQRRQRQKSSKKMKTQKQIYSSEKVKTSRSLGIVFTGDYEVGYG